ncbi:homocysteine S-methyltransferase [Anaerolineales bacterium HSG6]|nr:homocysteine S-methyltransferase [Anaerolineales bacterium HSG6]
MPNPIQPFLDQAGVMILDGALATELERRGADLNDPLWSAKILLEAPDLIRQVHYDYFVAGADIATTATYQATFEGLAQRGINHAQAEELLRLSVQLANEARNQFWQETPFQAERIRPLIAASIGPYAAFLADGSEYRGNYGRTIEELMAFHRPRLACLVACGVDLLACETIPCPEEAEALLRLLAEFPDQSAWLSFSCRDTSHVSQGELLADCVALANNSPQVVAVGLNCTPPRYVPSLLDSLADVTTKPLLVYPNSGENWDSATSCWLADPDFADLSRPAQQWYQHGAQLIGGCCRTTPADITAIRQQLGNIDF